MVDTIYPKENKTYITGTEAPFLDLDLSIPNDLISTKLNDKGDGIDFDIANFPFSDHIAPRATSYGVQSTLVISNSSNSKGLSEILRYIRSSTYQIYRIEEKIIRLTTFNKFICI